MAHFELPPSLPKDELQAPASLPSQVGSEVAIQNVLWFITLRWIVVAVFLAVEIAAALVGPALRTHHGIEIPSQCPWILALALALAGQSCVKKVGATACDDGTFCPDGFKCVLNSLYPDEADNQFTCAQASCGLDGYAVALFNVSSSAAGGHSHPIFVSLDLFRHSDLHLARLHNK